jgi:hypothetical protein
VFRTSALFTRCPPTKIWNVMSLRRLRFERRETVSESSRPGSRVPARPEEEKGARIEAPADGSHRPRRDEPRHPNAPPTRPRRPC